MTGIGARLAVIVTGLMAIWASSVAAQTYSIVSVSTTDVGNVAAAASGATVFTVSPTTGAITKKLGNGARVSVAASRSLVTISCGNQGTCNTDLPKITISQTGIATNRANALTLFTLSTTGATASIVTAPGTGNTITATLGAIGQNSSKTIFVGKDTTYLGDDSAAPTGSASASFLVQVTNNKGSGGVTSSGLVTATVFRTLTISNGANLSFGRVSRPQSGSGTVSLTAGASAVAVTGIGVAATSSPAPTSATLTATGEGGQVLTIAVPSTFTMSNGGSIVTVTTNAINSGAQTLSGTVGSAGTKLVTIGGSFPLDTTTALGAYSGSFAVTFQYN